MEFVIFWLLFAVVVGVVASSRGRSGVGWFLLAVVISPLLAIILVALMPSKRDAPSAETHVRCAMCAEPILKEALKCKHCGHVFEKSVADREREALRERADRAAAATSAAVRKIVEIKVPWQTDAAIDAAKERDKRADKSG
jgi:hypothetical protein